MIGLRRWDRVQLRDGMLVFAERAYDSSQVSVSPVAGSPQLFQLRLMSSRSVQLLRIALPSAAACTELLGAIARWLADDDDDESAGSELEFNLRWEISRVEEETKLWHALAATVLVLVRRVVRDALAFGIFFVVCVALGLGMVRAVADELQARHGGEWIDASCQLDGLKLTAEHRLSTNDGPLWKVRGTYAVQVRFDDGCDDGLWRGARSAGGAALEYFDDVIFYESYDTTKDEDDGLQLDRPAVDLADAVDDLDAPGPTQAPRPGAAACADDHNWRLDPLRGQHIAYRTLVLDHDDFCYGPIGSNVTVALQHCRNTQAVWLRHPAAVGGRVPCHVLYKALDANSVEAHVVLLKALPWEVRCYFGYWALLACQLIWLLVLCAHRLYRCKCFVPERANAENVADILSLAGGVGRPNSQLSKQVELMYASGAVARRAILDPRGARERPERGFAVLPLL